MQFDVELSAGAHEMLASPEGREIARAFRDMARTAFCRIGTRSFEKLEDLRFEQGTAQGVISCAEFIERKGRDA